MIAVWFLAVLAAVQHVKSGATLRSGGCAESDAVVAPLKEGASVEVKFSMSGCFLVSATVDGKTVEGYLPGDRLTGADDFERARREAAPVGGTGSAPPPAPPPPPSAPDEIPHPDLLKARDLLNQNRPSDALEIYLRYIKLAPKQPSLLAAAGYASYRADRVADAIDYLKRSLELRDNPQIRALLTSIERESSADRSKERKFGTRFLLRYDTAVTDPDVASTILALLEEEFSRVQQRLGCRADERIVTIVQGREQYRASTGAAEWTGALYDGKIRVPLVPKGAITAETRRTFAHEIVHACLANLGRWPSWFHEGLAQQLSGQTVTADQRKQVLDLGRAGKLPRLDRLNSAWIGMSAAQAAVAYAAANVAMGEYLSRHGDSGIRNIIANATLLPRMADELDRMITGKE